VHGRAPPRIAGGPRAPLLPPRACRASVAARAG
jgi:hypothetical protein